MKNLSLRLESVCGQSLNGSVVDGCRVAAMLDLNSVTFDANGDHYVCYPNGGAQKWSLDLNTLGRHTWDGHAWTFHAPIITAVEPPFPGGANGKEIL